MTLHPRLTSRDVQALPCSILAPMPELPEVEFGRRLLHAVAAGRTIVTAEVADDDLVVPEVSAGIVRDALLGARVTGTDRHGKHLWLTLHERPCVLFHFGMTGALRTRGDEPLALETGGAIDRSWPPRFTKVSLGFDDGGEVAFVNARRLGRVRLRSDPHDEPPISALGFDPLKTLPSAAAFGARIGRRATKLKVLLLDQGFAAGVGNWIADEVLYQARLAPHRTVDTLDAVERDRLRLALRRVIKTAVRLDARKDRFPRDWLFHHRWGKAEGARTRRGAITFTSLGGRTTAWVPAVQR